MSYTNVNFYFAAHQDDWLLFGGQHVWSDLCAEGSKVVFIYTTAAGAGLTDGWWEAREQGAIASVRASFVLRGDCQPLTTHIVQINGHPIVKYVSGNTVMYHMRVIDGNIDGTGYPDPEYGYQSLTKLRDDDTLVSALDGSTTYTTWSDFCETLTQILDLEREGIDPSNCWVCASDYCAATNPGNAPGGVDHADHKATADAVRQIAAGYNRGWYLTYCTEGCNTNLDGALLEAKHHLFYSYVEEARRVYELGGEPLSKVVDPDKEWADWGSKEYFRLVNYNQPDLDDPTPCDYCPE